MKKLTLKKIGNISNLFLRDAVAGCFLRNEEYYSSVRNQFDIGAEPDWSRGARERRIKQLKRIGVITRNQFRSFYINRISPGCLSCPHWYRKGYMVDVSGSCNRKCFFCYHDQLLPVSLSEVKRSVRQMYGGGERRFMGIGNSEPLLFPERVFAALKLARKLTGGKLYSFLYTNGDLLSRQVLRELKRNALDEIRVSIKPGERNLTSLRMARKYISRVMVEMPVFPGDERNMREILRELNGLDIFGVNLSHFLCTSHNKDELKARGYKISGNRPVPYYKSFMPHEFSVRGSEASCFNLLEFAVKRGLSIGVHYCSNSNFRSSPLNERLSNARAARKNHETVTEHGLLKKLAVYRPDHDQAVRDLLRNRVDASLIEVRPDRNRMETHVKNLGCLRMDRYEIGVVYSMPDGSDVEIRPLNYLPGRKARLPFKERQMLEKRIMRSCGRTMFLQEKRFCLI